MNITLTLEELANIIKLSKLAEESINAERLLKAKYAEELKNAGHDIRVYERYADEYSGAGYLTPDWKFKFMDSWNPSEVFELQVTKEEIYACLKADFYKSTCQEHLIPDEDKKKARYSFYVKEWIERSKRW